MKAFPSGLYKSATGEQVALNHGMLLRDFFAAKAMQQLIILRGENDVKNIPLESYKMADAMMEARNDS